MRVINPADNQFVKEYNNDSSEIVQLKLEKAQKAFLDWKKTEFSYRAKLMRNAAEILRKRSQEYAELMTIEMGKLISSGKAESEKCAWVCDYYAENAEKFLQDEPIITDADKSFITYQPFGVILAIMPWNFPFWQVFRFAAPNLMAGNAGLLKHASNVPGCALQIEKIFLEAGFPEAVFQTLLIGSTETKAVIENPIVKAVTLTGSTPAGKSVAETAGKVLKKCVLELGGSDPYIILADADIDNAVDLCLTSKLINSGQSCIAAKRFIVVKEVVEEFTTKFLNKMSQQKLGDPTDPRTKIGPMARTDLRDELHHQVQKSIEQGAKCILGGYVPEMNGAFYPATILTDVKKGMLAYSEEIFGPVAVIITAVNEAEAIQIANDTSFGLGAAIFTSNQQKGEEIAAKKLEAGCCFVNDFVKSDPRLPFGGIKESGFGRELARAGILEFVNTKTVSINNY
ncbi:MAG: NAD-dependent succinate-semialdehyde dehydrogenase [Candidatus Cloacimonetes bacterium]|nr:NAD-dependent succinate-semialdehyde dehydrogenase [Candidatus Cloacimonadota bacterium]MCF7813266.1 NAD-dependent succinate-semialdehyde dehydrogenase [Candidatus Cloacimonadota bacterium]MCF7867341.1 NAD-dependent succinate-semialdehyde dehydrogenase [Candidatus Cloacimonadota bacterium]MCF7882775.1 NAD-dependent succinate-semialdehyde dehydrogenase [Candidatus Cloacimonadota bacterium]